MKASPFAVQPAESVRDWTRRTVNGLVDTILQRSRRARAPGGTPETVHLIRTTVKQLRALLRLLRPVISAAAFAREDARLKTAAARLSAGRDSSVALKTLTSLAESARDNSDSRALLRLKPQIRRTAPHSQNQNLTKSIAASLRDLTAARRALLRLRITDNHWTSLGMPDIYRRAHHRMRTAAKHPHRVAILHHWRVAVKRLYYQLQWLQPLWPKHFANMIPLLHDLEHTLGSDHDLSVLEDMLSSTPGIPSVFPKAVKHRHRRLRHRCHSLAKELFRHSPGTFAKKFHRHAPTTVGVQRANPDTPAA